MSARLQAQSASMRGKISENGRKKTKQKKAAHPRSDSAGGQDGEEPSGGAEETGRGAPSSHLSRRWNFGDFQSFSRFLW